MWDEGFGTNAFYDVKGGVHGRNCTYGSRWRKGVVKHHHYSRTQHIIESIQKYAMQNNITGEEAVEQFEAVYKEKCSLYVMVKHFQSIGLLEIRERRLGQSTNGQSTVTDLDINGADALE